MNNLLNYEPPNDHFLNRVILITGANRGIGRSLAKALLHYGATVVLHGRDLKALNSVVNESCYDKKNYSLEILDLKSTDKRLYENFTNQILKKYGKLDGVVHNAGILGERKTIENYNADIWNNVLQVNLNSVFMLTKELLPLLHHSSDPSMIFTTSGVGNCGRAKWGAYSVSKFGVEGLAQTLADELKNTTIRVNYIDPGATRTDMRKKAYPDEDPNKLPSPDEILSLYLYLLGPDSTGITGHRMKV